MVINSNLIGSANSPLANLANRTNTNNAKASNLSSIPSGASASNSQVDQLLSGFSSDIEDTDAAHASARLNQMSMFSQPATALAAQANLSPDTVLSLLQE